MVPAGGAKGGDGGDLVVEFFPHWAEAGCWGVVLADVAHHVAKAYSQRRGTYDPTPILQEIVRVMRIELVNPVTRRTCLAVWPRPVGGPRAGADTDVEKGHAT